MVHIYVEGGKLDFKASKSLGRVCTIYKSLSFVYCYLFFILVDSRHGFYFISLYSISTLMNLENTSSASPCVSYEATEWGGPSDETGKAEGPCHSRCSTIKIPPCSKTLNSEHRPKHCCPSPAMVTSPYKWKISWTGRKTVNNQSMNTPFHNCVDLHAYRKIEAIYFVSLMFKPFNYRCLW
jgi:hypothetical protein